MNSDIRARVSTEPSDLDHVMEIVATFGAPTDALDRIRQFVGAELANLGKDRYLYLLADGSIPVAAVQMVYGNLDDRDLADGVAVGHIHALQVRKDRQRQGLAKAIMQFLEDHARSIGFNVLTLAVESDNLPAVKLYEGLGYQCFKEKVGRRKGVCVKYLRRLL